MPEEFKCPIRIDGKCTGADGCIYGKEGLCDHPHYVGEELTTDKSSDRNSDIDLSTIPAHLI